MEYVINDALGVKVEVGDRVKVSAFGFGARLADIGHESVVSALFETRMEIVDTDGQKRRVGGSVVQVLRRDGRRGFEGNKGKRSRKAAADE